MNDLEGTLGLTSTRLKRGIMWNDSENKVAVLWVCISEDPRLPNAVLLWINYNRTLSNPISPWDGKQM